MNPIFAEARATVDMMWIMGLMTVVFLAFFVGWIVWAWWPSRKADMEAAARMPFDEGLPESTPDTAPNGAGR